VLPGIPHQMSKLRQHLFRRLLARHMHSVRLPLSSPGGGCSMIAPHDSDWSLGRFRLCVLANVLCKSLYSGAPPTVYAAGRLRREDQDLVSASATAKHASCCRCVKRRPGILDRDRQLPSSRPLVHCLCDHITRSRLAALFLIPSCTQMLRTGISAH
jgi:hypothetical protein